MPMQPTRRTALGLLAGATAVLARPRPARAAKAVSFALPWVPEGANMIAYIAKENGYWSEAGLDVTVSRGSGSVAAAQAIGAGRFDFGLSIASAGLQQAAKGLPLVQLACCSYDAMMGVAVHRDGPIRMPKDLEGHSIVSTTSSGEYPFLPAYAAAAGVDYDKVKHIAADPNVRNSMFAQDKVDAVSGVAPTLVPSFKALGTPIRFMLYSKVGLSFYGNMLMTQASRVASDPDTVQAVTTGLMQAVRFVLLDPDGALKILLKAVPEIGLADNGAEQTRLGIGLFQVAMLQPAAAGHPLGYIDPATFAAMANLVLEKLAAPGDKMPAEIETDRFIGTVSLTAAERAQADGKAEEFRKLVA